MKFTVVWRPLAESGLADLWVNAPDRDAITAAADHIDAILGVNPTQAGESRGQDTRVLIIPPLPVHFAVREDDRLVIVTSVWRWGSPT